MALQNKKTASLLTVLLITVFFVYAILFSLLSVLLSDVINAFGLEGSKQGVMRSCISIGSITVLVWMMLRGSGNKGRGILVAGLLAGMAHCAIRKTENFYLLLTFYVLIGMGYACLDTMANAYMVDLHEMDKEKYLGMLHAAFGIGSLATPYLVDMLRKFGADWRDIYACCGTLMIFCVAAFALTHFLLRGRATQEKITEPKKEKKTSFRDYQIFLSNRNSLLLTLCMFFYNFMLVSISLWLVRYTSLELGRADMASLAFSLLWGAVMLSRIGAPHLRIAPMKKISIGILGASLFFFLCILSHSVIMLCIGCICFGLFTGHCIPSAIVMVSGQQGESAVVASSAMVMVQNLSSLCAPLFISTLVGAYSLRTSMLFPCLCGLLAAGFAFAAKEENRPSHIGIDT